MSRSPVVRAGGNRRVMWLAGLAVLALIAVAVLASGLSRNRTAEAPSYPMPAREAATVLASVEYDNARATLRVFDGTTLAPLDGVGPIQLEFLEYHLVSPDRRRLAAVSAPNADLGRDGRRTFRTIDLETGATLVEVEDSRSPYQGVFSADGKSIYWLTSHGNPSQSGSHLTLDRLDLEKGGFTGSTELPAQLMVWDLKASPAGGVAIFGTIDEFNGGPFRQRSTGTLLTVDPAGQMKSLTLPGLDLVRKDPDATGYPPETEQFEPGRAWDLDRGVVHIVRADELSVMTVRIADLEILAEREIVPKRSIASALFAWLVPSAHAKEMIPSTNRQAQLSPDGKTLFLTGSTLDIEQTGDLAWQQRSVPLGLSVIRVSDMAEIEVVDGAVWGIDLSPDGRHLVVHEGEWASSSNEEPSLPTFSGAPQAAPTVPDPSRRWTWLPAKSWPRPHCPRAIRTW